MRIHCCALNKRCRVYVGWPQWRLYVNNAPRWTLMVALAPGAKITDDGPARWVDFRRKKKRAGHPER